jgi:hypothetical protein
MLVLAMQFSRSCALKNAGSRRGDEHAAPADPEKRRAKAPSRGGPVPFLQNGIVMTAEPRLGLPTLEKTHRGALRRDKPISQ